MVRTAVRRCLGLACWYSPWCACTLILKKSSTNTQGLESIRKTNHRGGGSRRAANLLFGTRARRLHNHYPAARSTVVRELSPKNRKKCFLLASPTASRPLGTADSSDISFSVPVRIATRCVPPCSLVYRYPCMTGANSVASFQKRHSRRSFDKHGSAPTSRDLSNRKVPQEWRAGHACRAA